MSFQKKRPIRDRLSKKPFTLSKSARGCNKSSTETRAEKLARKAHLRAQFHAAASDNYDRTAAILAGTHYTQERRLADGRVVASRKVDRHNSLPHIGEKEVARRVAR